jgi:hypothetical protein
VRPDISEFSFGYVLTSELITRLGLKSVGAPVFPSLLEEGKVGYDVAIPGLPLFLQFKLSDHMVRGTALEATLLGVPYYRMHLRPRCHSKQHELLRQLESKGNAVYYVAPEFHTPSDLNQAYDTSTVIDRSTFWRPIDIGLLPDDDDHYIAFQRRQSVGYFCSEPREIPRVSGLERFDRRLRLGTRSQGHPPTREYWQSLGEFLVETWREVAWPPEALAVEVFGHQRDPQDRAAFLAQTLYACALLWMPAEP